MDKERALYNKFVDVLNDKLDGDITPKELEIVMKFLANNNIQATTTNEGLSKLAEKVANSDFDLPFEDEEIPAIRRVK